MDTPGQFLLIGNFRRRLARELLVVMRRFAAGGGLLVAVHSSLIPAGTLPMEPGEDDVVGPRCRMEVPGVKLGEEEMLSVEWASASL